MTETADAEIVALDSKLSELRCSACSGYLSYVPIQVLPDGNSICGRCTSEEQTYRNLRLEAILNNALLPCRYKRYGCEEVVLFGHTDEHEIKCDHRSYACPLLSDGTCAWEGSALQILHHCTDKHPDLIIENAEFQVHVDQDVKSRLILIVDNAHFLIKFCYSAGTSNLYYQVSHFIRNLQEFVYKIRLINDIDDDYCIMLKGDSCIPYSANLDSIQGWKVLILNNFLQNLNNPNCIKFAVDINLIKSGNKTGKQQFAFNYNSLQTKCNICRGYLTSPFYNCPLGVAWSKCMGNCHDSKLSENAALKTEV